MSHSAAVQVLLCAAAMTYAAGASNLGHTGSEHIGRVHVHIQMFNVQARDLDVRDIDGEIQLFCGSQTLEASH